MVAPDMRKNGGMEETQTIMTIHVMIVQILYRNA